MPPPGGGSWRPELCLGYNPIQHLAGAHALAGLGPHAHALLTGPSFFPHLISAPFRDGLDTAFAFSIVVCLIAAAASMLRGGNYRHAEDDKPAPGMVPVPDLSGAISTTKGSQLERR